MNCRYISAITSLEFTSDFGLRLEVIRLSWYVALGWVHDEWCENTKLRSQTTQTGIWPSVRYKDTSSCSGCSYFVQNALFKVQNVLVYSLALESIDEEEFVLLFDALSSTLTMTDTLVILVHLVSNPDLIFLFHFQAKLARDALSKALYSQLFDYLVQVRSILRVTLVNAIFCF